MKRRIAYVSSCVLSSCAFASLAACDESSPDTSPETRVTQLRACTYDDFSVEVTDGPSAGTTFTGALTVYEKVGMATFSGAFAVGADLFPVSGHYGANGQISVTVDVDDGYVVGIGPAPQALCASGTIEGVATGPVVAADYAIEGTDTGHWRLGNVNLQDIHVFDVDLGGVVPGLEGGFVDITINVPDSVIDTCFNANNNQVDLACVQRFCTAQLAGTAKEPDAGSQQYRCESSN